MSLVAGIDYSSNAIHVAVYHVKQPPRPHGTKLQLELEAA